MASKDNRTIKSAVRFGSQVFSAGDEDGLAEFASQEQLDDLAERGAIEGNWKAAGKAKPAAKDAK